MTGNVHPLHIGIVAGEASGDTIGAGLILEIKKSFPDAVFEGIGGKKMQEAGCFSIHPLESLSIMGLTEVLMHLPEVLSIRKDLKQHFLKTPPDIFIGIDAPDFNLGLERSLKRKGIRTLHYVSPSVWAWRQYRVRKIAKSVDRMLTLFPFEEKIYRDAHVPVCYVGHPLADLIADHVDPDNARHHLGLEHAGPVIALLPGSRVSEVKRLAAVFVKAAHWCRQRNPDIHFLVPLANEACRDHFEKAIPGNCKNLPMTLLNGQSLEVMAAADVVLLASGTATLECMLLKRPMVVAYKLSALTYQITRWLLEISHYSLPNLLVGRKLVPEIIQHEVTASRLGTELMHLLENPAEVRQLRKIFGEVHQDLKRGANRIAADAVLETIGVAGWSDD